MAKLAELLQQTGQPIGLRGQALAAFIQSGDQSSALLFRQLLTEHDSELLQLAALGSGALQDAKSCRLACCTFEQFQSKTFAVPPFLALYLSGQLPRWTRLPLPLTRDDNLRRAAAEALSNHPGDGYTMLKEGASMKDDLMVRRAAAYGLAASTNPGQKNCSTTYRYWTTNGWYVLQLLRLSKTAKNPIRTYQSGSRHLPNVPG